MNNPLLSVIIPSYNQGAYIASTILSVLRQQYQNWEIIIQDGASTDNTHHVVKPFVEADTRITFRSEKDKGFSDAVNKALERCNGEYGIILNSDDFISGPTVFSEAVNYFSNYPGLYLLSAPHTRVDEQFNELIIPEEVQPEGFVDPLEIYTLKKTFGQSSTFFSMKRIREIGLLSLNVDMVADTDTWIRMATYEPTGAKKVYFASHTWSCATFHYDQRSVDQSKFMVGRAQMFTDLLFDPKVTISQAEKKRVATIFAQDAYDYLIRRKMPTKKVEDMYKRITGHSIPVAKVIKKGLFRSGAMRKILKGDVLQDGTAYFLSFPRGQNYKWFTN